MILLNIGFAFGTTWLFFMLITSGRMSFKEDYVVLMGFPAITLFLLYNIAREAYGLSNNTQS